VLMIVIGADIHKSSHTCVAVAAGVGEQLGVRTAAARKEGFASLLDWGRGLGSERVWAIEDCRHVSGGLERFLIARGERVVRVAPKLSAQTRVSARERGKSDAIDALAVARAALREGVDSLPVAFLDDQARAIKWLADHREALVGERTRRQNRLRWLLHDRWPELEIPAQSLDRNRWLDRIARRLARAEQTVDVRIARDLVREIRSATRQIKDLEHELAQLVADRAPALLELPGCGPMTAATIITETAGPNRFPTDAKLARTAGVAPIPASSGKRQRHRLDRGGNRKLNCALHRIAITQGRCHPPATAYLARKQAEGKTRKEAIRALKRHLARTIWHHTQTPTPTTNLT
jgi:transposase